MLRKFTYFSNNGSFVPNSFTVCSFQNLHISQTWRVFRLLRRCFVEFKIYISLKHSVTITILNYCFVEFKIYISLKRNLIHNGLGAGFVEFKIYISLKQRLYHHIQYCCFVEFKIYISLKQENDYLDFFQVL